MKLRPGAEVAETRHERHCACDQGGGEPDAVDGQGGDADLVGGREGHDPDRADEDKGPGDQEGTDGRHQLACAAFSVTFEFGGLFVA